MPKPSTLPRWATDGAAQIVEPTSGKKDIGHVPGERPPAQYENWFKNSTWEWLDYVDQQLEATRTIVIPACAGTRGDGADADYHESSGGVTGVFGGEFFIPFGQHLRVGDTITGIRLICDDAAATTVTASARKHAHQVGSASPGGAVAIGGSPASDNSGNVQSLAVLSGGSEVVAAATNYLVKAVTSGATNVQLIAVEIDFVRGEL